MNRNKILLLFLLAFYLVIGMLSCAKKQSPDTAFSQMLGKWKLAKTANAINDSGALGAYYPVSKEQDWIWTFKNDGTATELDNDNGNPNVTINYTWKIVNSDSLWMGTSGAGHDTTTYFIANINSSALTLTSIDTTNIMIGAAQGYYFIRQ